MGGPKTQNRNDSDLNKDGSSADERSSWAETDFKVSKCQHGFLSD